MGSDLGTTEPGDHLGDMARNLLRLAAIPADTEVVDADRYATGQGPCLSAADLGARLRDALQVRQTVTLAVGIVMNREGVSADDAHAMLLQSSHQKAVLLREQAEAIVASTQRGGPVDPAKVGA